MMNLFLSKQIEVENMCNEIVDASSSSWMENLNFSLILPICFFNKFFVKELADAVLSWWLSSDDKWKQIKEALKILSDDVHVLFEYSRRLSTIFPMSISCQWFLGENDVQM